VITCKQLLKEATHVYFLTDKKIVFLGVVSPAKSAGGRILSQRFKGHGRALWKIIKRQVMLR